MTLKPGSVSCDFPLYHSEYIPTTKPVPLHTGKKIIPSNVYTNEHPDFFKLDCMNERGYNNPFLDKVIPVDRSEGLKKINAAATQINFIDYLKKNRKFSQDTHMLKFIRSEFDDQMFKKRQKIKDDQKAKSLIANKYKINNKNENYNKFISKLESYNPRIDYKMKNTLDNKDNIPLGKYNISKENYEKIKNIGCEFDPSKTAYLSNHHDYQYSEAQNRNTDREFNLNKKKVLKFSLINGKKEMLKLSPIRVDKWGSFYENYLMLLSTNSKFRRKGGLFTEFSNKNIEVINVNKRDIRERLANEKKKKMEKLMTK